MVFDGTEVLGGLLEFVGAPQEEDDEHGLKHVVPEIEK